MYILDEYLEVDDGGGGGGVGRIETSVVTHFDSDILGCSCDDDRRMTSNDNVLNQKMIKERGGAPRRGLNNTRLRFYSKKERSIACLVLMMMITRFYFVCSSV